MERLLRGDYAPLGDLRGSLAVDTALVPGLPLHFHSIKHSFELSTVEVAEFN
jgi:hypothetical protein